MNRQISRLSYLMFAMIFVLLAGSTFLQFFDTANLRANAFNSREYYRAISKPRGSIIVEGTNIAYSEKSNDLYKYQRFYNDPKIYAPITGYFSVVQLLEKGVEASMNAELSGESDAQWFSHWKSLLTDTPNAGSVVLTINDKIQKAAYAALGDKSGAAIALDPKTGRILAMVSKASYDPNLLANHNETEASAAYQKLAKSKQNSPLNNKAIEGLYPPGSVFKLVTAAAALESGEFDEKSLLSAPANYELPGTSTNVHNYANKSCSNSGKQTIGDGLKVSCNTLFAKLGVKLGAEKLIAQAAAFGVGTDTIIAGSSNKSFPMRAAQSSILSKMTSPDKVALAAFGQGEDQLTVLQVAMIFQAIANNGELLNPYLVDSVLDSGADEVVKNYPKSLGDAVSETTAKKLTQMMVSVTENGGTATNLQIPGMKIAAKTGTAEIGSEEGNLDVWAGAFAPADDPKIAVVVFVENTPPGSSGESTAVPIVREIIQEGLK